MSSNPFINGKPVLHPEYFFGRKNEVNLVFTRLCNPSFESSSLVGERRIGKTSLLNYLMNNKIQLDQGLDPNKYLFIYEDLEKVGKDITPKRLWQRLLQKLAHRCHDTEVRQKLETASDADLSDAFALGDLFDCLHATHQQAVFLLDEFEHVTNNTNFGPDFFHTARSLIIHNHLALVTSSRRQLDKLCHSDEVSASPFFNVFSPITVRLFTEEEARELIVRSLETTKISFTNEDIKIILDIAGPHPCFLQAACFVLFEEYAKNPNVSQHPFPKRDFESQITPNMDYFWRCSDDQEKIVLTVLALLERQRKFEGLAFKNQLLQVLYERSGPILFELEDRGLLTKKYDLTSKQERYCLFNTSFNEWIYKEITATVRDQQSYNEWLNSNMKIVDRISSTAKKDMSVLLPKISSTYRELIVTWVSDPKNLVLAVAVLKSVLGFA